MTHPDAVQAVAESFWARVDRSLEGGCWLWSGLTSKGYGRVTVDGRTRPAHRYAYEVLVGPIPEGLQLDHLCRVRNCVNPAHLEPVTQRENIRRGLGVAALLARRTHCNNGHEFTPENTRYRKDGTRRCWTCGREQDLRSKRKWESLNPRAPRPRRTHCKHGHPFDEANTYYRKEKGSRGSERLCRACNRESVRQYADRRKRREP